MEENIFNSIFNTEIGRKILALTKASFKVSDLIPDLVLREKIKSQVLVVYKKFIEKNHSELLKEIDILEHYFYLGGHLNLVKEDHLKQLRNGFLVFKSHIILLNNTNDANGNMRIVSLRDISQREKNDDSNHNISKSQDLNVSRLHQDYGGQAKFQGLNAKQKKILEKFESKDTLKLAEILELFPDVSEKTIRNELASLINLGKITRDGRGNGSFYKLLR